MEIILDGSKYIYHELPSKQNLRVIIKPYPNYWFLISYISGGDVFRSKEGVTFIEAINELNEWLQMNFKS